MSLMLNEISTIYFIEHLSVCIYSLYTRGKLTSISKGLDTAKQIVPDLFLVCVKDIQLVAELSVQSPTPVIGGILRTEEPVLTRIPVPADRQHGECYRNPGPVFPAISERLGASYTIEAAIVCIEVPPVSSSSSSSRISNRALALPI